MAPPGDLKRDQVKPAQSTVLALQEELRRRGAGKISSCTSPSQTSVLEPHHLEQIQKASEKHAGPSRGPILLSDVAGKGGHFQNGIMSPAQSSGAKVLVGQLSMPTPASSTPKVTRVGSGPAAIGGGVPMKKKRTRASKKPHTRTMEVPCGEFLEVVQSLTGGTFCSQATATAIPIVSSAPSISSNLAEPSSSALEPYVVRPQASRPNAKCSPGDAGSAGAEVPTVPPAGSVVQELPAFLLESMQSQSDEDDLNMMMGYSNQSSWSGMDSPYSSLTTASVGVSVSSQFSEVYSSDLMKPSSSLYSRGSMPFLREGIERSKDGNPYQPEVSLDIVSSEEADLQRHQSEEDYDVDSWIHC